jgi:predicted secreted protein
MRRRSGCVELTEQDGGRTVTVAPGSVITVRLEEARTAGFKWMLDDDGGDAVALTSEDLVPGVLPGGRAVHEFRFVAREVGSAPLRFVQRRPWAPDDQDASRVQIRVDVVGATQEHAPP